MLHARFRRFVYPAIMVMVLCATVRADLPQFSARTMDGESISASSLRGRVVLVQFWATWCGYCRRDQPIVDELERRFADKGLVVLAVNVGESEEKVRTYLLQKPRACRVVLDSEAHLASRFGVNGFPFYAVVNEQGKVVAAMSGSGGEPSLLAVGSGFCAVAELSNTRATIKKLLRTLRTTIPSQNANTISPRFAGIDSAIPRSLFAARADTSAPTEND